MHTAPLLLLIGCCVGWAGAFLSPSSSSGNLPSAAAAAAPLLRRRCQGHAIMNLGGRPAGKSAAADAKKRKKEDDLDPDRKKQREQEEMQARRNLFRVPGGTFFCRRTIECRIFLSRLELHCSGSACLICTASVYQIMNANKFNSIRFLAKTFPYLVRR
jgi:hypothetical protein